ncbi:hypothetical protein J6590_079638 [Homalodisca vitripennis]|nr:hypothetical protein J6590_079638 [Homalodisca vitripennis]
MNSINNNIIINVTRGYTSSTTRTKGWDFCSACAFQIDSDGTTSNEYEKRRHRGLRRHYSAQEITRLFQLPVLVIHQRYR